MLLLELIGTDSALSDSMGCMDPDLVALAGMATLACGLLELSCV